MKKLNGLKRQLAIEIICFLFILLFMYAGLMKGTDVQKFKAELDQSPLLMAFSDWLIWTVPVIEFVIIAMLMIPNLRLAGLYSAYTLMAMFTVYIVVILNFADRVPCSCGGILEKMNWETHLVFNIVFTILAATAIILLSAKSKIKSALHE